MRLETAPEFTRTRDGAAGRGGAIAPHTSSPLCSISAAPRVITRPFRKPAARRGGCVMALIVCETRRLSVIIRERRAAPARPSPSHVRSCEYPHDSRKLQRSQQQQEEAPRVALASFLEVEAIVAVVGRVASRRAEPSPAEPSRDSGHATNHKDRMFRSAALRRGRRDARRRVMFARRLRTSARRCSAGTKFRDAWSVQRGKQLVK